MTKNPLDKKSDESHETKTLESPFLFVGVDDVFSYKGVNYKIIKTPNKKSEGVYEFVHYDKLENELPDSISALDLEKMIDSKEITLLSESSPTPPPIPQLNKEVEKEKEKEALIKRLIEFDAITQKYMHVLDQIEEALSQPGGEKLSVKIEDENSDTSKSFWTFRDLGEPYKAVEKEIHKKLDGIEAKRVALAEKRKSASATSTPEPLPTPILESEPAPSPEPATPEPAFVQEPDRTQEEKNKIVREFLEKGEKEKAQEFLLREVELKRKNNLEKGLVGKGERIISGISKGIEKWDNLGKAEGWKGYAQRVAKTSISLAMVGIASGLTVEGIAKTGIITASSLSGGLTSYLGRRLALGTTISALMTKIPDNKKKWVSRIMLAGSVGLAVASGGFIAGGVLVASSAIGLGAARLVKKFDGDISPEQIIKNAQSGYLDLDTLEADVERLEKDIEKALKEAEKERIYDMITKGTTAWMTSTVSLLAFNSLQHHPKIETEQKVESAPMPKPTEPPHAATPTPEPTHAPEAVTPAPTPASTPVPETVTPHEPTGETHEAPTPEATSFHEESITFTPGKGAIQGILDLKTQMSRDFNDDFSHAPKSVQDFMAEPNAAKQAIHLGLFKPGAEDGQESALVGEGSVLKFDEHGNLTLHDTLTDKDSTLIHGDTSEIEKFGGKMFHSGHDADTDANSAETTPTPTPEESVKSQDSFHLVDTSPHGLEETNLADSNSPLQPDQPSPEEIKARIIATMFAEENKTHDSGAVDNDNTDTSHNEPVKDTHEINSQKDLNGVRVTQEQFDYLEQHPELVGKNPFHLHNVELVEVIKVHEDNLGHLFPENTAQYINELKQLKAKDYVIIGEVSEKIENPLINYLHKLAEITKTEPKSTTWFGLGKAETVHEYMIRALQKAEFTHKLDQLKIEK